MNFTSRALADRIPLWHFEGNSAVFSDGSLGAGFKLKGFDASVSGVESFNQFAFALENLIHTAREGLTLQLYYKVGHDVSLLLHKHEELTGSKEGAYQEVAYARFEDLQARAKQGKFFQADIYLFIRSEGQKYQKKKFWEAEKKFIALTQKQFLEQKEKFERDLKQMESSLTQAGLEPIALNARTWVRLLFDSLNPGRADKIGYPQFNFEDEVFPQPISQQILLSDVIVNEESVQINEEHLKCLSLKTLPEAKSTIGMVLPLLELPFAYEISQTIKICDQKREIDKLHVQRRVTHSFASGSGKMSDLESESKLGHIEELIRELLEGSEKIVASSVNVLIKTKDRNELQERSDEVLKAFRSVNQSEGIAETLGTFDGVLASLPGLGLTFRDKKMKSSNATHLMSLYTSWGGNARPICLLPNRDGELVRIDPFASSLPNWNGLIFGGSGAGKSFTILHLMLMFYGQRPTPKIVWIDNGASSQKLLEVLDGEFVDLNIKSSIRINPFDLEPGLDAPTPSKIKLILAVLESILKEGPNTGLPKRNKALLEEAIFQIYEMKRGDVPTLSDLKVFLKAHSNLEMKAYADTLFSWTGETAYGQMLDGKTNIALQKDLITVETKGLDDYPDLQNVFLLLFTDYIKSEASRDKSRPYLLILDEAWKMFQTPSGLQFTIEAYRTFRKFFGGIWCISQNYKDFLFNQEIRNAIFPNTTSTFVLKQRAIDWKDFAETLQLNEAEIEAIKSIQVKKGEYSEIFFMQDTGRSILRIVPDPLGYYICTSDPVDKSLIEEQRQKNPELSQLEVLKLLANKRREHLYQ
ncbi:MAG: TraC family protein [Bacteriovoracia bacterium]